MQQMLTTCLFDKVMLQVHATGLFELQLVIINLIASLQHVDVDQKWSLKT